MQTNFLEELIAQWYEYKGYIIKRNEKVGLRKKGGYEGELDIVAFNPRTKHIIHIETSTDANAWEERKRRFKKKFLCGKNYIKDFFVGLEIPNQIENQAIFAIGSTKNHKDVGGGQIVLIEDLLKEILEELKHKPFAKAAVPEKYPILRVLQMITTHRRKLIDTLK